jgi:hypothetical protein
MSEDDIKFYDFAGSICLRVPAPMKRVPLGARWCDVCISKDGAERLKQELSALIKEHNLHSIL